MNSRSLVPSIQRSTAVLKTAIATSAVSLASRGFAALLDEEFGSGGLEARGCGIDRRQRIGRAGHRAHDEFLQGIPAAEQNLALVGEVPEERSLGQSRPLRDLRHRGLLEASLAVEGKGRLHEPAARVRFPSGLYRLALEQGPAGSVFHAVADEGVPTREIAEVIGRHLNVLIADLEGGHYFTQAQPAAA